MNLLSEWLKAIWGDFFGILSFLRRATIITSQFSQDSVSAIQFKVLLFSRKLEKMFRHFYIIAQPHKPGGQTSSESLNEHSESWPPTKVCVWGGGSEEAWREEPGRGDGQPAFVLASPSASTELGPSNCPSSTTRT